MDMNSQPLGAHRPYDPHYDPLTAPNPGRGTDYAPTFSGALKKKRTKDGTELADYDCDLFDGDKVKIASSPVEVLRRGQLRSFTLEPGERQAAKAA